MRIQTAIVSCCLAFFSFTGFGEDLPKQIQQQIDSMIYAELDNHAFPGAAFICGNADTILYARNYGFWITHIIYLLMTVPSMMSPLVQKCWLQHLY